MSETRRLRWIAVVVVAVLLVAVVAFLGLFLLQRRLIYFPSDSIAAPPEGLNAESIAIRSADGTVLSGWFMSPSDRDAPCTVVVFNGNAGNRTDRLSLAGSLSNAGFAVVLFDYRGYGGNSGSPSEQGLSADGLAVARYVKARPDVESDKVVYLGESLGAGVAVAVSLVETPALLILRSPFTSLADVAATRVPFLPIGRLIWDDFPNLETIGLVEAPVLVVAGSADRTVPVEQSIQVFDAANEPKTLVIAEGADHNDRELTSGFVALPEVQSALQQACSGNAE